MRSLIFSPASSSQDRYVEPQTLHSRTNSHSCILIRVCKFQKIPKWWIWYYWICPVAWTVYGLIVSQYGDVEDSIRVPGMAQKPTVKAYIEDHFGYEPDFMGPVAAVLVAFTVFFAFMFAFCIKRLNFQTR